MKNLIVLKNRKMLSIFFSIISIFQNANAQTDTTTFDVKIFQDELSKQMKFSFTCMDLDTNLYPVLYASSQVEAGSPACYGTHKVFYMNAVGSEKEAAVLAVRNIKNI